MPQTGWEGYARRGDRGFDLIERRAMQCKDIPDEPILRFLAGEVDGYAEWVVPGSATWFADDDGRPYPNSVLRAMPAETPVKLALAKMDMLIRKGVVEGCTCGCRGEFEITDKGRARLALLPARVDDEPAAGLAPCP